jgi:hypothetical protein
VLNIHFRRWVNRQLRQALLSTKPQNCRPEEKRDQEGWQHEKNEIK